MGILSDLFDQVKAWVTDRIEEWIQAWGKVVKNVYTTVQNIVQNTYNYVTENITNVVKNITESITNVYNIGKHYITNVTKNITENITNVSKNIINNISNVIGASIEWVDDRLLGMRKYVDGRIPVWDPLGFLKDPITFIETAVSKWIWGWGIEALEALVEGVEKGMADEYDSEEGR